MNINEINKKAIKLINERGYMYDEEVIFGEYMQVEPEECLHLFPKDQMPSEVDMLLAAGSFSCNDIELTGYALIKGGNQMVMLAIVDEEEQGEYWNASTDKWAEIITERIEVNDKN